MDSRSRRPVRRALAMCCLLLAVGAMLPTDATAARATRLALQGANSKHADTLRLVELDAAITYFKTRLAENPTSTSIQSKLAAAIAEYDAVSARLGGDRAPVLGTQPAAAGGELGGAPPAPPNCVATSSSFANATPVVIPTTVSTTTTTILVAGAGTYLNDVDAVTNITHTFNGDIDMTLTSPAGTIVTLTTDNGSSFDNVFNGTTWDDDANPAGAVPYTSNNGVVTDHVYADLTLASPLVPEEALGAFLGEDPNGTWTLTISDDAAGDGGAVTWSLNLSTLAAPPVLANTMAANATPVVIPTTISTTTTTIVVAGAGTYLSDVDVLTNITHTFCGDIDMTLTSPAGTIVTLTTDNGSSFDNVFNGTLWNDDANPAGAVPYTTNNGVATEHVYADLTLASPLVPEEALGAFVGEDPNGTWTLTISDDAGGDGGAVTWSLDIDTAMCMVAGPLCTLTCPADITTTAADLNGAVVTFAPTATNCINVVCNPPSGSTFPVGTTVVTCTGEDDVPNATRGTVVTTYSSGNIAVPLPDVASMTPQVINVADMGTVLDVDLRIRLNHTFDNDLDITLTGPNAVTIDVSSDNGGSGDNYGSGATDCSGTPTVFDDEAATGIASGVAPFAGSFIPEVGLSAFDGIPAAGNWTLNIADDLGVDVGTLFCYELVITRDIVVGGGGSSCQFNVNVTIPFDSCCVDDASGDIFRQVVASVPPTSPLYGYWEYEVAATSEIFAGIGNHVAYRPGLSIIIDDNDDPAVFCHAEIDFPRRKCRVQVRDITTGRNFVLRDRNINNNMCTVAPPPQS
ncbi:MAG: proprotein convertase P-domain-containing protein [Blastocatellia bacterium]|nr:proprotein convertase P-domain-containing protein [Blastocatellia bacterium]